MGNAFGYVHSKRGLFCYNEKTKPMPWFPMDICDGLPEGYSVKKTECFDYTVIKSHNNTLVERYRLDKKNPHTLKWKCLHFDEILITVCTGSCQMTTSSAASDENFVKMTTFSFQCITNKLTGSRSPDPLDCLTAMPGCRLLNAIDMVLICLVWLIWKCDYK